ncbi:MAG: hypothetical protein RL338_1572 [Chloroflexota bacterium]|jgi:hypothetical protein
MIARRDKCPRCSQRLTPSKYDTTFRFPDRSERLCFAIPASLCADCRQLWVDPDLLEMLDLGAGRCVFAIETDLVLQERAWTSADQGAASAD